MKGKAVRLLHLTDTHLRGDRHADLRGVNTWESLRHVQAHAAQLPAMRDGIDGTLLTGDLVHDDPLGYATLRDAFANQSQPVYCIPGNHDVPDAMHQTLSQAPFVLSDHALLRPWLVILLSTWQHGRASGKLGGAQIARMEELLQTHPTHHALICLHHHPISMNSQWLDQVGLRDAEEFRSCITRYKQVRGVLWGHVHQALDSQIDGVLYMSTPATCIQFLPGSDDFAVDVRPPGYRHLILHTDGRIETTVTWLQD